MIDIAWALDHLDELAARTFQHVLLAGIAVAAGFAISLALAVWVVRRSRGRAVLLTASSVLYTVPSLALFAALVPVTGLSILTAEIPLILYTLVIFVRNILAGLDGVPDDVLEAADAMGYRSRERLLRVEMPLAVPLMITGIRLAAVTLIGLATVASILGSSFGGLGQLITEGLQTFFPTKYVLGAVLSVLLAFVVDFGLVRVERLVTPWARARAEQAAPT